ncbi:phage tail assembly chaperone family protein, TAC [Erwinia persicina]|uniref:phage tail assembly chaperone family protein, TAC n=1 Tax=Erwinia persicina TaxID=55211 RepID=UPI000789A6C0|nr:phage tail assembly chaperone family protein, TAC [Erwinia persicina]MCQ4105155.1 phage tail assembly chaperone family protein, TAC [Erwinia persicina]UTX11370.1 phage tail assembly chaperone family protein, TAC [Erwinia persicina]
MKLTLESLKKAGAFTGRPVEKEITWKQGEEEFSATVFIRPLGYHTATSDVLAHVGKVDGVAGRIAASVCDESGRPVFTPQDITGEADADRGALDGQLTIALLVAIQEVNDLGKTTNSAPKMSSGVNSSSTALVEEPLLMPEKT